MSNILAQLNPAAMIAVAALLLLSLVSVIVLRLVRKGRAKNPGDLVKIAREHAAAAKETKAATKRAEAAIAAPVAPDRLSRISKKGMAIASEERDNSLMDPSEAFEADDDAVPASLLDEATPDVESEFAVDEETGSYAAPFTADSVIASGSDQPVAEPVPADPLEDAELEDAETEESFAPADASEEAQDPESVTDDFEQAVSAPAPMQSPPVLSVLDDKFDFADAANHPANWDELLAVVRTLKAAIQRSWSEDLLAPALRTRLYMARAEAGAEVDDCLKVRSATQQLSATDLARTINNAAREQAAEIIAVVEECANQMPFTAQDCSAVMAGLSEVQWMALIERDGALEKRTMPLTRHDPEAPLWAAEAFEAMRRIGTTRAAAA